MGFHCIYSLIQAFGWKSAGEKLARKKNTQGETRKGKGEGIPVKIALHGFFYL